MLRVAYGITKQEDLAFYVNVFNKAVESLPSFSHGIFVVDYFPLLKYVPGEFNCYLLKISRE
jgi:hypothetical protein